jgi:hypothetical protein
MLTSVRAELERLAAEPGDVYGVLLNPFGECMCVPEGAALPPHEDIRRLALLTTAGLLNGADTLDQAAERLRDLADRLADAGATGWRLVQPVLDDLAFVEGPVAGAAG